jgi:hypothetical protein
MLLPFVAELQHRRLDDGGGISSGDIDPGARRREG